MLANTILFKWFYCKVHLLLPLIVSIWRKLAKYFIVSIFHNNNITLPTQFPSQIKMVLQTPLRLQNQSKILSGRQNIRRCYFTRQTMRRVSTISQLYEEKLTRYDLLIFIKNFDFNELIFKNTSSLSKYFPYSRN